MPNSLVKNDIHITFHVKSAGVTVSNGDMPRLFDYIGGIVRSLGGLSFIVGGVSDHVHILASIREEMEKFAKIYNIDNTDGYAFIQ